LAATYVWCARMCSSRLCLAAAITSNRTFHAVFVILTLVYQLSWILRLFDTIA
jgi:hypothetical protein